MVDLSLPILAFVCAALVTGGAVKGVLGIGLPVVAVSIMSSAVDVPFAVSSIIVANVATNIWQSGVTWATWDLVKRFWLMIALLCVGLWWSASLLTVADPRILFAALGVLVIAFSLSNLYMPSFRIPPQAERWVGALAGTVSGLIGGFSSVFAPPMIVVLVALRLERDVFVRATGLILLCGSVILVASYWVHGVLGPHNIVWSVVACVPVAIGYGIGRWLGGYVESETFRKLLLFALIVIGLNLLRRGLL